MSTREPEQLVEVPSTHKGISLRDIIFIFYRRKWVVISVALPLIFVGSFNLLRQTGSHVASSRVLVELVKVDLPKWNVNARNVDFDRELSTLVNIAASVPVASSAAVALQDSIPKIKSLNPELVDLDQPNALRDYLLGGLQVSVVGESNILEFRFSSIHPEISLMAVGALRSAFFEYRTTGNKNPQAIEFYAEQIGVVRAEVDSLLRLRTDILEGAGYSSLKDDLRYDSGQLNNYEDSLFKAEAKAKSLSIEYELMLAALEGDPRDFPVGLGQSSNNNLVIWRNLVSKHEDSLNNLLATHTKNSLPVRRQEEVLELSLKRLQSEEENFVESIRIELLTAENEAEAYRQRVMEMNRQKTEAPLVSQKISIVDAELNSLTNLLRDLQGKRGEVRISQLADERVSSLVLLTDPEMMENFGGGRTAVYLGLVVVMALSLGIILAFVRENLDHRVFGPKDIEEKLQLPVFASVSKVE